MATEKCQKRFLRGWRQRDGEPGRKPWRSMDFPPDPFAVTNPTPCDLQSPPEAEYLSSGWRALGSRESETRGQQGHWGHEGSGDRGTLGQWDTGDTEAGGHWGSGILGTLGTLGTPGQRPAARQTEKPCWFWGRGSQPSTNHTSAGGDKDHKQRPTFPPASPCAERIPGRKRSAARWVMCPGLVPWKDG